MLQNLLYSINAIIPILVIAVLGVFLKKYNKITDSFTEVADWIVFKLSLPVMLFLEVAKSSLSDNLDVKLILFLICSVTLSFFTVAVLTVIFVKDKGVRGAFIQGACRSNFAILGVPLAVNMFGEIGGQVIAITMPFVILMFNTYSVIILSVFSDSTEHKLNKKSIVQILKNIVTNPLIIAVVLALPFMLLEIEIPTVANKTLNYISGLATPLALLSLGASFNFESLRGKMKYAVASSLCKTVFLPAIMVIAAALIGLRGPALGVVLICFGAPTAVSSYIMSKKMNNDHELSSQILLLSTIMCAFTIFIGIFILKTLQLI